MTAATAPAVEDTASEQALLLHLDGFDGPLDLLLELARAQKVDLWRISILSLVEQYLAVIEGARRVRLELAADWLVMAAWLAWLKSRLLLPAGTDAAEDAEQAAEVLAERLRDLQAMRRAAIWLDAQPVLGRDVLPRGAVEDMTEVDRSRLAAETAGLVRAYLSALRRAGAAKHYRPAPLTFWTVQDAVRRLESLVGRLPAWTTLERFLPLGMADPAARRAALASTLIAGLELARGGTVALRQETPFGPILVARSDQKSGDLPSGDLQPMTEAA